MKKFIVVCRKSLKYMDKEIYVWKAYTIDQLHKEMENDIFLWKFHVYAIEAKSKKEAIRKAKLI